MVLRFFEVDRHITNQWWQELSKMTEGWGQGKDETGSKYCLKERHLDCRSPQRTVHIADEAGPAAQLETFLAFDFRYAAARFNDLACRTCRLFSTLRSASPFIYCFGAGASKACNSFELGLGFALRATIMSDGRKSSP